MKIIFEMDLEEKPTNIGIAKALIETHLGTSDLSAISKYLSVYCDEMVFFGYPTEKGGAE